MGIGKNLMPDLLHENNFLHLTNHFMRFREACSMRQENRGP